MAQDEKAELRKRLYYVMGRIEALRAEWKSVIAERRALAEQVKRLSPPYDPKLIRQRIYLMERPPHIAAEIEALGEERKKIMASARGDNG
jgi:hypothetical protein